MVNAEILLATKLGGADTLRSFVNGGFGQKYSVKSRLGTNVCSYGIVLKKSAKQSSG